MDGPLQHRERVAAATFLPDFCGIRMVFSMVVVAELLALVLTLGAYTTRGVRWEDLGITSLFIQWVALTSAGLLCVLRRALARINDVAAGIVSYVVVLLVTALLSELAYRLAQMQDVALPSNWHTDFLVDNLGIGAIVAAVALRFFYLQHQQVVHMDARVEALQARIRPHFLFNSMNTIAALIRSQPRHAEEAVEDLCDLFRFSLADAGRVVTLDEELQICRRYLRMEQQRLGARLAVVWDIDALPRQAVLPPLSLQPLLENAIYHGIELLPHGGTVAVHGRLEGDMMVIVISNPVLAGENDAHSGGRRIALANIRERLRLTFGRRAQVTLDRRSDECEVQVRFPVRKEAS